MIFGGFFFEESNSNFIIHNWQLVVSTFNLMIALDIVVSSFALVTVNNNVMLVMITNKY